MTKAPNILSGASNGPIPVPKTEPFDVVGATGHKLLDEMATAAQWQLMAPTSASRRAWRHRYTCCYIELRARLAPKGAI